jgi:cellobiose phosphorylase
VPKYISTGSADYPISGFNSVSEKPVAYEGDKEKFVGMYRSLLNPIAIEKGKLSNTVGDWYDSISSLQNDIDLGPGEEKTIVYTIGYYGDRKKADGWIKKYHSVEETDKALEDDYGAGPAR